MKSLKFLQKLTWMNTFIIFLLSVIFFGCTHSNQADDVNPSNLDQKVLIVKQGSPFKDLVTTEILLHYKSSPIVVEVIDIGALENTIGADFDAIVLMHRWEASGPPETVQSFIDQNSKLKNKIVVLSTSWNGLEKMKNVDAITGASLVENESIITAKIIKSLDRVLKYKK